MLALVSFWTSPHKQQPGIVIEQLNDDENEWKGRYEFPACRHPHTSQVWFQEQLCGFNPLLLPLWFFAHTNTHPYTCECTPICMCARVCACARTETHKQELLFLMAGQRPLKLFTAVQLGSPPIFQFQICFIPAILPDCVCGCIRLVPPTGFRNNDPTLVSKRASNYNLLISLGSF